MPAELISLDQASWRLEKSGIPGRAFAELLVNGEPPLIGLRPGNKLREHVDLSRVTGLLVEPGRPDELAAAIDRILSDAELARTLGTRARARALAEFDVAKMAERYESLYAPALDGARR